MPEDTKLPVAPEPTGDLENPDGDALEVKDVQASDAEPKDEGAVDEEPPKILGRFKTEEEATQAYANYEKEVAELKEKLEIEAKWKEIRDAEIGAARKREALYKQQQAKPREKVELKDEDFALLLEPEKHGEFRGKVEAYVQAQADARAQAALEPWIPMLNIVQQEVSRQQTESAITYLSGKDERFKPDNKLGQVALDLAARKAREAYGPEAMASMSQQEGLDVLLKYAQLELATLGQEAQKKHVVVPKVQAGKASSPPNPPVEKDAFRAFLQKTSTTG